MFLNRPLTFGFRRHRIVASSSRPASRKPQGIIVLVDVALFTITETGLSVLVHERPNAPFRGKLALPGGYIRPQEDADAPSAARRVLADKTGIEAPYLEQLGTYSGADRDPGGWSLSVAYYALAPRGQVEASGTKGRWLDVDRSSRLAFDHDDIVGDAVERIRNKSAYSSLPAFLAGERFTMSQLQAVYEQVLGTSIDKVSFRRRMAEIDAIEPVDGLFSSGQNSRPAQIYRIRPALKSGLGVLARGFGGR